MLIITDGNPRGLGYFLSDQRDVPASIGGPRFLEADTFTCSHCQLVVILDRSVTQYKCSGCNHHICERCANKKKAGGPCVTWSQRIEAMQEQEARRPGSAVLILP